MTAVGVAYGEPGGFLGSSGPATAPIGGEGDGIGRLRVVHGTGGLGVGAATGAMSERIPKEIFRLRRSKQRLDAAEDAIEAFMEEAALESHHAVRAGLHDILACVFRLLERDQLADRYGERRDIYVSKAMKALEEGRRPARKRRNEERAEEEAESRERRSRRETPVDSKAVQGDRPKQK